MNPPTIQPARPVRPEVVTVLDSARMMQRNGLFVGLPQIQRLAQLHRAPWRVCWSMFPAWKYDGPPPGAAAVVAKEQPSKQRSSRGK